MPTSATTTFSVTKLDPIYDNEDALEEPVNLIASIAYAAGTVLGEVTATPGTFKAYASGASDGSQVPKAILRYACATDSSGNITLGTAATGGPFGETQKDAPAFFAGTFRCSELTGLDANAVTVLGRLVNGTVSTGVFRMG